MPRQYIPQMAQGPAGMVPQRNDGIAALILNRGNIQAQSAADSGNMWANLTAGLGQQIGAGIQQYGAQKEEKKKQAIMGAQDQAFLDRISDTTKGPLQPAEVLRIYGMDRGPAIYKGYASMQSDKPDLKLILAGHKALSPEMQAQAWPREHDLLVKAGVPVETLPPPNQYSQEWVEKFAAAVSGEKAKVAEPYTLSPGQQRRGVNNELLADNPAEPKAAPRLPAEEAYIKAQFGDNPTPQQLLQGRAQFAAAGREPKGAGDGDAARKRLVEAVAANPALYDRLTPTEVGQIAGDLHAKGFDFGKSLPEKAVTKISESKSAVDSLNDLRTVLKENEQYIGPIAGFQALNPYSDANKAQAKIDLVRQRVGKALEGGVLRKEDEEKYKKILATLRDEPSTAIFKIDNIIKNIENDLGNYIEEQKLAGRRVNTGAGNRPGAVAAPAAPAGPKAPKSKSEYDALPSGTRFTAPDGSVRIKP